MTLVRVIRAVIVAASTAAPVHAQTIDDGLLMPKHVLSAGVVYGHDAWDHYWEATRKRTNGNIGTLTTQSVTGVAGFGLTDRISVMAMLPYVWTEASQGTMRGLSGMQDLTVAAKYKLLSADAAPDGAFTAFIVGAAAVPVSDYTPDFLPLSIGSGGGRASSRLTAAFQSTSLWFVNASAAYTWCSNVRLDRYAYYTDGQLYMTNEVAMPNVVDYGITIGVKGQRWRVPVSLVQQRTLGGGDMRRQEMPFISNRMDFSRLDGAVMYGLPGNVSLRVGAAHVLTGRNVGQSTTFTSGLFYAFHL